MSPLVLAYVPFLKYVLLLWRLKEEAALTSVTFPLQGLPLG